MKKALLISIFLLGVKFISAQDFSVGFTSGAYSYGFPESSSELSYSFGLNAAYTPPGAFFDVSASLQYLIETKAFIAPISLGLVFGQRFRPRVFGGVGPVIRINPQELNVPFGIGAKIGIGLDYQITEKIAISSEMGWYFIPYKRYYYNHFSSPDISSGFDRLLNFSLGVKYYIL